MTRFYVVNESTEDTVATVENLPEAIRAAREAAGRGQIGDLVSVLEAGGKAIRQFVLLPDRTVAEQPLARQVAPPAIPANLHAVEPGVPSIRPSH